MKNGMKTKTVRWSVRLGAVLLLAILMILACAGCGKNEPAPATEPAGYDADATPVGMASDVTVFPSSKTGLRFAGFVEGAYLDALKNAYGESAVKVGMLFTPTENLTANGLAFTAEALDACDAVSGTKYVKVETTPVLDAAENVYRVNYIFSDFPQKDYARNYSAVTYVEVNGKILRYSAAVSARSLSELAGEMLFDLSDEKTGKYQNALTLYGKTVYSPYTQTQRDQLSPFCVTFTAMSYNIAVYDSPRGGQGWEGRNPEKVIETIKTASPDIVCLQEVNQIGANGWDAYLANLASDGGYTRLPGSYTRDNFEKNEILFKTDKFTKIFEGTLTFKQAADNLKQSGHPVPNTENADTARDKHDRVFHYVALEMKGTGRKILVVDTHLHYEGTGAGYEEDDKVRRYEISTLLAWLEIQSAAYPDQIVLGDMNAHYNADKPNNGGTRTMTVFLNGGYAMTSLSAKIKGDVGGTLATNDRATRAEWTFDHILTKGNVGAIYYTAVDNCIDAGKTYPSDHLPVMAELYLK